IQSWRSRDCCCSVRLIRLNPLEPPPNALRSPLRETLRLPMRLAPPPRPVPTRSIAGCNSGGAVAYDMVIFLESIACEERALIMELIEGDCIDGCFGASGLCIRLYNHA